ncbi:diguanylate cyclase [Spirulina subsalsa FACHB-351]|uniref:Diguanylate cyclase n=1 Tax=Spirulina subsalsa FACHB-351 TaxID=234711 RepID=A0ABT3L8X8_9CYAN|nr:diguanylate cyclase [Spirulina subsalsa]MCW6037420.1 diguanylate cyclase [Spirulina subsalsa FACHB-351]
MNPSYHPQDTLILIVDDIPDNIKVLVGLLDNVGYKTTFARSGKEALERLKLINPNLILLDLMMPEMSGLEVCEKIKANQKIKDIPIIFLTASHEHHNLLKAFEIGAADYVTKPFKTGELLARVQTHLLLQTQSLAIKYSEEKLRIIVEHLYDGILIIDQAGIVKFANPAAAKMFNRSLNQLVDHEIGIPIFGTAINEMQILRAKHEIGVAEVAISSVSWEGKEAHLISLRDVSERQEIQAELRKSLQRQLQLNESLKLLSTLDDLTNLANRRSILNTLKNEFSRSQRYSRTLSIAVIDLDHVKRINDDYGHEMGDQVIYNTGQSIQKSLRECDAVGRMGGDEFLVVLPETSLQNAVLIAQRIQEEIKSLSIMPDDSSLVLSASIGMAEYHENDSNYSHLLKRADQAMYQAKDQGRALIVC